LTPYPLSVEHVLPKEICPPAYFRKANFKHGPTFPELKTSGKGLVSKLRTDRHEIARHDFSEVSLDRLLDQLSQLADTEDNPGVFYRFATETLSTLAIDRIAVWSLVPPSRLVLNWPTQSPQSKDSGEIAARQATDAWPIPDAKAPLTTTGLASDDPALAEPTIDDSGDPQVVRAVIEAGQPRFFFPKRSLSGVPIDSQGPTADSRPGSERGGSEIVSPWRGIGAQRGGIVFRISENGPTSDPKPWLPFIAAVGEIIGRFQARQTQLGLEEKLNETLRIDAFLAALHASADDLQQAAYTIANDARPLIGCDRLSIALRSGNRWKVAAISGADHIHRHSPSAQSLQAFCRCAAATGVALWHDGNDENLAPQIADSMADYLDHSPAIALGIIPLRRPTSDQDSPSPIIGALVVEQYKQDIAPEAKDLVATLSKHFAIALDNAARLNRVPGLRLAKSLANHSLFDLVGLRTLIAITAIISGLLCLIFIPAEIIIRAQGELLPTVRREVFAPRDAVITKVLVEHGQWVESGQPLLELRSTDLDLETQLVDGELHQARKRLSITQSERLQLPAGDAEARKKQRSLAADEEQYQQQVTSLELRQSILRQHQKQLVVTAPIAGLVLTWNAEERLATRPVRRGESLLSVADTKGQWQAELQVQGRHAGRLLNFYKTKSSESQPATTNVLLASSTAPGTWIHGRLSDLSSRMHTDATGNGFLPAIAHFDNDDANPIPLVPGATAVARISCGSGSLGESLFFELADAIRLWLPL